ncbi:helix-turn-helix transcriptional regulator [Pedobacter cryoconitis]|uniref:AraC-like DNA-binding protein n=1 Tax=Pedobacter cryoconitis TaxID=188932 RepID=A0A327RV18_9SPHI|nr:helix-turn-helix transcriptional regulator [Pedobacter cryoconitis]RAJ20579.1 AraC-like DNA-binding protein [Pedobacter cryoconitis]
MKEITHHYGVELDWVKNMASQLGGYVDGNYIRVPGDKEYYTRYVCTINSDITAFIVDIEYSEDVLYKLRNKKSNFIGIYFNHIEGDAEYIFNGVSRSVGSLGYNLVAIDSNLNGDYLVKSGSKTFMIAVFIKKKALVKYVKDLTQHNSNKRYPLNSKFNSIIYSTRMSSQAWWLINELKKIQFGNPLYDVFITGTVYGLLGEYIKQVACEKETFEQVFKDDVTNIINSQAYLINNVTEPFFGINALAAKAHMSETKYKKLFKKITGTSPHVFFLSNKLSFAKETLETGNFTILEIADKFSFFDASHFIEHFKCQYGITPKEYLMLL